MYNKSGKRYLDIILCLLLFPFFIPIYVIVAYLIKKEDKGPIFFKSPRLGKNGKVFNIYKFRSMKVNAPDYRNNDGSTYNSEIDDRITSIGKVLRKSSIDEIPQLINVIKGEMSFIGPRPDTIEALEIYSEYHKEKLKVKPGITGYNQAFFRNSIPQNLKFENDVFYVKKQSLMFDIFIILKTIYSVLKKENINTNGEK